MEVVATLREHSRILWALMLRELATRYGRDNLGFIWLFLEPIAFTVGVLFMYRAINGPYNHNIDIVPFVFSGYMPMILMRHIVMYSLNAAKINGQLLYHRSISVLDLFFARIFLEFVGVSLGFSVVLVVLILLGLSPIPYDLGLMYQGWFLQGLTSCGLALIVGAISEIVEVVERIIGITLYLTIPVSGTFFMADWLPPDIRRYALLLPFLNCTENIRAGLFGPSIHPHYDAAYAAFVSSAMVVVGLLLVRQVRDRVDIG